jgi:hypothetical protein
MHEVFWSHFGPMTFKSPFYFCFWRWHLHVYIKVKGYKIQNYQTNQNFKIQNCSTIFSCFMIFFWKRIFRNVLFLKCITYPWNSRVVKCMPHVIGCEDWSSVSLLQSAIAWYLQAAILTLDLALKISLFSYGIKLHIWIIIISRVYLLFYIDMNLTLCALPRCVD